ncbi:unnamed protein product [Mytilus edulis]|uniref:Uncharacterized protein n=1 Tax=Mytilus edulis TaxID=6550 RepID=A0A8S3T8G3_MYTED|nr:unnamed protein product [Mytilus edulis]
MSTTDLSKFSNYLNNGEIYKTYPAACVPDKLKTPAAKKAKLLKFEEIDVDYYEPDARMVGYRTTQDRVRLWIKALNVYVFEYLGDHPENKDKYQIDWTHDPVKWTPSNLKSIAIDVTTKVDKHNPLMYKLTLFLKTGTLQVQGHYYKTFASQHFLVLRDIVHHIVSQQLQDNNDTMQKVSTDICASDNIDTITINHDSDDETDHKTLLGHNTIDVNSNIIDLKQIIPEAKPEAKENTNMVVQSAINTNDMNVSKLDSNSKPSYPQGKNVKESHEYSRESFESMLKTATNDLENQVTIAIEKLYIQHTHSLNEHLTSVNDTMRTQNDTCVQFKDLLLKSDASSEKENTELKFTLQQLRYESLTEIESLKSVINVLKGSMLDIENSNSVVVESLRNSNASMVSRIQARDQQIEALEADVRNSKLISTRKMKLYTHSNNTTIMKFATSKMKIGNKFNLKSPTPLKQRLL